MSIREMYGKIKGALSSDRVFFTVVIVLVAVAAFCLGRISVTMHQVKPLIQKLPPQTSSLITATERATTSQAEPVAAVATSTGAYVGSKKGTKYHLPWCSGAQRIIEVNKVWFKDKAAAVAAGYTPASNCPGI